MNCWFTYVTQMQGIEAGSGEIGVVGDQGVSVQGFRVPRPVQALRVRQTHSQWRTTLAESTGEEQADPFPAPSSLLPTWPTGAEPSLHVQSIPPEPTI